MKLYFYNFMKKYINYFTQATPIHPSYQGELAMPATIAAR